MDQIRSKTLVTEIKRHGVSGNVEVMQVYRVSQLDLGPLFFNDIPIFQEGESSRLQSIFLRPGQELSQQEPGRIGWQLFTNTCLLIDVQNRVLACCDSLDTLQERGYDTSRFSSCPLSIERGLVEFMAESPEGPIRCTLDSGATINLRHCDAPPEVSIQDMIFDEKNRGTLSLKIGGRNFGLVGYQSVPIRLPIPMELTLGMEFIETHLIFIDFVRKVIHFAPQAEFELALNKKSSIISAP